MFRESAALVVQGEFRSHLPSYDHALKWRGVVLIEYGEREGKEQTTPGEGTFHFSSEEGCGRSLGVRRARQRRTRSMKFDTLLCFVPGSAEGVALLAPVGVGSRFERRVRLYTIFFKPKRAAHSSLLHRCPFLPRTACLPAP